MSAARFAAERLGDDAAPALVLFIHGGFWRARYDASTIAPLARACAALGVAVWNLEYPRVGMDGGGWPGTAEAVGEAVDQALIEAGGRPVALVGHSAGGHLALWAAHGRPVALVISLAGVCDLRAAHEQRLGDGAVHDLFGSEPSAERLAEADPMQRLPLSARTLLVHGDRDQRVPLSQSRDYCAAALDAAGECELALLPGSDHFSVIDPAGPAWPVLSERWRALLGSE